MQSQAPRLLVVPGAEKLYDGTCRIHSAGGVDPWAKTEPNIVGSQPHASRAPRHFHQRTQSWIGGFWKILQAERDNRAILAG
jgi:hypothetical protein